MAKLQVDDDWTITFFNLQARGGMAQIPHCTQQENAETQRGLRLLWFHERSGQ